MDKPSKPPQVLFGIPMSESQARNGRYISGGVDGILSKIFNLICLELTNGNGVGPIQWNKLMIDYIRKMSACMVPLDRSSIRGNMNKELRRPGMTWKVLCSKALVFLKIDCFTFTATATLEDGREICSYIGVAYSADSKYREFLPKKKYKNPQGRALRKTNGPVRNQVSYDNSVDSVLAELFNVICLDTTDGVGINESDWNRMLDEYVDKYHATSDPVKRQSTRSNYKKKFRSGKMTWKVFCKALQFLKVQQVNFSMEAIREDGARAIVDTNAVFSRKK